KFKNTAPVGDITLVLEGTTVQTNYRRNVAAIAVEQARLAEVQPIFDQALSAMKSALEAKTATDKLAAELDAKVKQQAEALVAAVKATQDADAVLKTATAAAATARQAAEAKPVDAPLQTAKADAEKALLVAMGALQKTQADRQAIEAKLAEVSAEAQKALAAKKVTDATSATATAQHATVEAEKKIAEQRVKAAEQVAAPKKAHFTIYATPEKVHLDPAPLAMTPTVPSTAVPAGRKIQIPLTIKRLYGFADQVTVSLVVDPNSGIQATDLVIPKDQSAGQLEVNITPKASVASHSATLVAKMMFNNQPVELQRPVVIKVAAPVEQTAAK
ncbi:MAG: hypothetical protein SGJ20_11905, partial [Planctomycetota bacterium]|nr:hypothetical protein [Planctomycetota bacterium]